MPDKASLSKKAIKSVKNFEEAALCIVEVAEKITSRVFFYAWTFWHLYRHFTGKL